MAKKPSKMKILEKKEFISIAVDFTGEEPVIDVEYGESLCLIEYKHYEDGFFYVIEHADKGMVGCYDKKGFAFSALKTFRFPHMSIIQFKSKGTNGYLHVSLSNLDDSILEKIHYL